MSGWKARRFWTEVALRHEEQGWSVLLDARPVRTPAKAPLLLPAQAMAEAIAAEWRAVEKTVDPTRMPVTRAANAAIDKVAPQFHEVADLIAAYGGSDLLCYRADGDPRLSSAQAEAWDPLLDWAANHLGARLSVTKGVTPIAQPPAALDRLAAEVRSCTPFQLTALHDLVSLTGSLVLGLAAAEGAFDTDALWHLSRFDEEWQARQWGEDEESSVIAERKQTDFRRARHFWTLATS
jgi:chaperone required for assembly of F1-ATPase